MTATDPAMRTRVQVDPNLPPLAWLAEISGGHTRAWCGRRVEIRGNGFFEGCWADDFEKFNFDEVTEVFGSGAKYAGDRVVFVPPSHTLEGLFVLERHGRFVVSNSLPYLVRFSDLELEFDFDIGTRFASILKGTVDYERVLFRGKDWTLYRIFREHITVRDGRMSLSTLDDPVPFATFAEYKSYLLSHIGKIFANGASAHRVASLRPIATCSNGYDSPTCAALASMLGCDEAVALTTARGGKADSGREIAERLGMKVREFQRDEKSHDQSFGEAEFLVSGMGGEDYVLGVLGPHFADRIVVNGFLGGTMWQLGFAPTTTLVRKDCSGSSMTEHRLRYGYALLPVPFIGGTHHDRILRISESAEMAPYRIGGEYDRPIPRRILEERGIPRETFGQVKKGYSICFNYSSFWWSPTALADLREFERQLLAHRPDRGRYRWMSTTKTMTIVGYYLAMKVFRTFHAAWVPRSVMKHLKPDFPLYEHNHPRYGSLAFLWALDKMRTRYPSSELTHAAR
jgi:hypothetical protein